MKLCSRCNLYRPAHEFTPSGRCIYCDKKHAQRADPCYHRTYGLKPDGSIACRNCGMVLNSPRCQDQPTEENSIAAMRKVLGLLEASEQHDRASATARHLAWNELTRLLGKEASPCEVFDKILPPE